jgi:hypothetical protein
MLIGQPFWVQRLSKLLTAHAADLLAARAFAGARDVAARTDLAVRVGYRPGASSRRGIAFDAVWHAMITLSGISQRAYYWVGTDVLNAHEEYTLGTHTRWFAREATGATHWAGAPWLAEELNELGVPATSVLFPAWLPICPTVTSLPVRFSVLTYIPDARPEFYGAPEIFAAARAMPEARFTIFGGSGDWAKGSQPPNVTFVGWLEDVTQAYLDSSVVVRLVPHDAVGGSVREALSLGRHVLYSYLVPHTRYVPHRRADALISELRMLSALNDRGDLAPNRKGMAYASGAYDPRTLTRALAAHMRQALA